MLNTALKLSSKIFTSSIKKVSNREGFGEALAQAGETNKNVVVLTADLTESTHSHHFAEKFPERFIQVGVAEQNMAGIAAGLALSGKVPFITSYGVFSPGGNWSQIRTSICYSKANVKIVGSHGGLATGKDGATHQALEDIATIRVLPDIVVLTPADYNEAKKATLAAAKIKSPVYIRLTREAIPNMTTSKTPFEIGKAQVWAHGKDVTIISCGPIIYEVLLAAKELKEKHNISCEVINYPTIKPLDKATIITSVKKTKKVITVEDHQITGGLGGAIAEFLSQEYPVKIKRMGVKDNFGESGTPNELRRKHNIDAGSITKTVKSFL